MTTIGEEEEGQPNQRGRYLSSRASQPHIGRHGLFGRCHEKLVQIMVELPVPDILPLEFCHRLLYLDSVPRHSNIWQPVVLNKDSKWALSLINRKPNDFQVGNVGI